MNSNGSGGIFPAIAKNKGFKDMIGSLEQLHIIDVNNVQAKVLDPVTIGFSKQKQPYVIAQATNKQRADEAMDVYAMNYKGRFCVARHANISQEDKEAKNDDGSLTYRHGNINDFVVRAAFLTDLNKESTKLFNFALHTEKIN